MEDRASELLLFPLRWNLGMGDVAASVAAERSQAENLAKLAGNSRARRDVSQSEACGLLEGDFPADLRRADRGRLGLPVAARLLDQQRLSHLSRSQSDLQHRVP